MSGKKRKDRAFVTKSRRDGWVVRIELGDGTVVIARPATGNQRIVYDRPQNVPRDLKHYVVPHLVEEARIKNLQGE